MTNSVNEVNTDSDKGFVTEEIVRKYNKAWDKINCYRFDLYRITDLHRHGDESTHNDRQKLAISIDSMVESRMIDIFDLTEDLSEYDNIRDILSLKITEMSLDNNLEKCYPSYNLLRVINEDTRGVEVGEPFLTIRECYESGFLSRIEECLGQKEIKPNYEQVFEGLVNLTKEYISLVSRGWY